MRHRKTYISIFSKLGFISHNRAHKFIRKNRKLHKFATTKSNFQKLTLSDMRTCISIFGKIGLVDQSNRCTR